MSRQSRKPFRGNNRNKKNNSNFYNKVTKVLQKVKILGSGSITFYYRDGAMRSMPLSSKIFSDDRGRQRNFGEVIAILNDLKHDFNATRYIIS